MSKRVSVRAAARSAKREDTKGRKAWADSSKMKDSFQNFTALMGIGTANVSSGATYVVRGSGAWPSISWLTT